MKKFLVFLKAVLIVGICLGAYYSFNLYANLQKTKGDLARSTSDFQEKMKKLETENQAEKQQIDTLTKLTTLDPDLLKKYSKVYFLNENYVPANLVNIDSAYVNNQDKNLQILDKVDPYLEKMLKDANDSGVPLRVTSSYRSFATQKALKAGYKMTYGAGTANQFSADQGYSEHQLGTTLDFTTPTVGGANIAFLKTTAYPWMKDNAYKYGFIISYPEENEYYEYEPWHWRFVGVELATYVHDNETYFYKLDQRLIDSYLVKIFD